MEPKFPEVWLEMINAHEKSAVKHDDGSIILCDNGWKTSEDRFKKKKKKMDVEQYGTCMK